MFKSFSLDCLEISPQIIYSEMGYGNSNPNEEVSSLTIHLLSLAMEKVTPSFYFHIFDGTVSHSSVDIDGTELNVGSTIATLLRRSVQFTCFAATAGMEYQVIHNEFAADKDNPLTLFIWDSIGTCITEATGDYMERFIEKEIHGMHHTNRFSPGYCGWQVSEQKKLFGLMPKDICGIRLTESAMMYPVKSISGITGIGKDVNTHQYGCQFCNLENCYKKRRKHT